METSRPSGIDWRQILHRLERGAAALAGREAPTAGEMKAIFKARAKALAGEENDDGTTAERIDVIEFLLAYERYAIELDNIREVYPLREFTPLPGTPPFLVGIINVRGQIVSVVDLKNFFDLPAKGLPDLNRVIIISDGEMEFGVLADSVTGVRKIARSAIQPAPPTLTGIRAEYLKGVTADGLAVLDALKLLGDPKLHVSQSADM